MFYYPSILQHHTGPFATIWLAATGASKIVKRECLKVNIPQTCEDILSYILVRVPPEVPGGPHPRFSLYLSAQLQFGVILVYNRQCQYLMEEIQYIMEHLNRIKKHQTIDLTKLEETRLLLPNQLNLMEILERAPDPFFGTMEPLLPSPFLTPHVQSLLEAPTPERSPLELSPLSVLPPRAGKPRLTASPEEITMKEYEPITLLEIEGEQDLPEITVREIDFLEEQKGFLVTGIEEEPLSPQVVVRKRHVEEESVEKARVGEPWVSLGLSPPTGIAEEMMAAKEEGPLLMEEIQPSAEVSVESLEITLGEEPGFPATPTLHRVKAKERQQLSPEFQLAEYQPSPSRLQAVSKHRRQLCFVDEVTQISRSDFQKQISDVHTQCRPLAEVLLPAKRFKTAAELLNTPTIGWMHPTLHRLWARCAKVQKVNYAKRRAEEKEWTAEITSEREELRIAEEPSGPPVGSSEISLETTEEEARPSLVIPEERVLLEPENGILPVVPELPEVSFEFPLDRDHITFNYVYRYLVTKLKQVKELHFDQMMPPTVPRDIASCFFNKCLVLAGCGILSLEQEEPYSKILIKQGWCFPSTI